MWVPARGGSVPARAVLGGRDKRGASIYVGRARFSSELLPAKVVPNHRTAYVSFAGREHRVANYEVKTVTAFPWNAALFLIRNGLHVGQETILTGYFFVFPSTYKDISGLVS
jgi:hypothetical protein